MNIVGEGFPEAIINQIDQRQKRLGSLNRTNQELVWMNSKTGWVRMVSSVDVEQIGIRNLPYTGTELAKNFILFGGTSTLNSARSGVWPGTGDFNSYAYGLGGTEMGLKPMPGINSADIKTETRGSLKTATISITAHNRQQFDIIDLLYMRLGYSVLLEWGHSSFFYNSDAFEENNPFSLANDFLNGSLTYENHTEKIQTNRLNSNGNYDAVVGKVINFSWSFNPDGTYTINLTLRSMGDVIESLKTNILLPGAVEVKAAENTQEATPPPSGSEAPPEPTPEEVIKSFANAHEIGKYFYELQQKVSSATDSGNGISFLTSTTPAETGYDDSTEGKIFARQIYEGEIGTQYYIKFAHFLWFLEKKIIPSVNNDSIKLLKINNRVKSNIIYNVPGQISSNPGTCIFDSSFGGGKFKVFPGADSFALAGSGGYKFKGNFYGQIMNAYFNVVFILTSLDSLKDEKGKVSLYDLLARMTQGFCDATGNINQIEPTVNSETNEIIFTDQTSLPDRDAILASLEKSTKQAVFDVYGLYIKNGVSNSGFVRDLSFTTTVSPNLATMITVGATANGYVPGSDSTALSNMNSGLKDRFKSEIFNPEVPKTATSSSLEDDYKETIKAFNTFLAELSCGDGTTKAKWNQEAINAFSTTQVQLLEYQQAKQTQAANPNTTTIDPNAPVDKSSSPNSGFLPFDLSITIDGLSGFKVYQKYTIDTAFLPTNYPTSLEFIVKGINQRITKNEWTTTLESFAIPKNPFGASGASSFPTSPSTTAATPTGTTSPRTRAENVGSIPNAVITDNLLDFSKFVYPVTGIVTSKVAVRAPIKGGVPGSDQHRAIDIGVPKNTPVYSSTDGVVVKIGAGGYGNQAVYIKVDNSFFKDPGKVGKNERYIIYGHLEKAIVKVGQSVKAGQQIGLSGDKDSPGAFHLHYQIRASLWGYDSQTLSSNLNTYFPAKNGNITAKQKFITG